MCCSTTCAPRASSCRSRLPSDSAIDETPALLDVLEEDGYLRRAEDDRYYWSHENFPASSFSLRSGAPDNFVIVDTTGDRNRVLGEMDLFAAPLLVHEEAIYIHEGVQYQVDRLDWDEQKAFVRPHRRRLLHRRRPRHHAQGARRLRGGRSAAGRRPRQRGEVMVAWQGDDVQEDQVRHPRERRLGQDQPPRAGDAHHRLLAASRPAELVNRYDRDTLDGALIGLARVARTTALRST